MMVSRWASLPRTVRSGGQHVSSLKPAMMGLFPPQKLANRYQCFSPPRATCETVINTPLLLRDQGKDSGREGLYRKNSENGFVFSFLDSVTSTDSASFLPNPHLCFFLTSNTLTLFRGISSSTTNTCPLKLPDQWSWILCCLHF